MSEAPQLRRELSLGSAVWIGLGSMIGAGVFAAFSPAAQAAGNGLLIGLAVAGLVAFCNAASSAQLAAVYPRAGGTYVYGRERLGPWWGFVAGWSFVIGKTASCAAMALTFAAYAAPPGWERPVAIAAVVALVAVNLLGVTRTAQATRAIVVVVLLVLAIVVAAGISTGLPAFMDATATTSTFADSLIASGPYGILQSAGLLFFAFAGFARIATMGEEVREPAVTIPRAILVALGITVIVYATIAVVVLGALGPVGAAESAAPLAATTAAAGWGWADPIVRVGAAAASLGALLALLAGIGRTSLAMARERDLPGWLAAVHPRFSVPYRAEMVLGLAVCALVATIDLRGAIGFSSFGVLLYYFVANLSALTQPAGDRRYPRAVGVVGMLGCLTLVVTLPVVAIAVGIGVVLVGVAYRALVRRTPNSPRAA